MERIHGAGNWKLTIRREAAGVTILRASTCDARAVLPAALLDLPVIALGDHALAPEAPAVSGEELLVACGPVPAEAVWSNRALEELTLPAGLRRVGDYALLNCGSLETLSLHDGVARWGGGVLMNCRLLRTIRLTRTGPAGDTLFYFADELSRELDVTIYEPDGGCTRLLFPEYVELYEENCPAHHFDYTIYGAGYPYHHCFRRKRLDLREYDRLWPGYLAMEHDESCAMRLALWRLRYPAELSEEAAAGYAAYLRAHFPEAVRYLLDLRDMPGLDVLLQRTAPDRAALSAACALAREGNAPEAVALLLERQHRQFPAGGAAERFAL